MYAEKDIKRLEDDRGAASHQASAAVLIVNGCGGYMLSVVALQGAVHDTSLARAISWQHP